MPRPQIEPDARCLLAAPMFAAQVAAWRSDPSRLCENEPELAADIVTWSLHALPFGVKILQHRLVTNDWAYNDENHYTEYRFELDVQNGTWQKTVSAASRFPVPKAALN